MVQIASVTRKICQISENRPKRAEYVDALGLSSRCIIKLSYSVSKQSTSDAKNCPVLANKLPKSKQIAQSGHTANRPIWSLWFCLTYASQNESDARQRDVANEITGQ